jgi:hypothetical protein
VGGAGDANGDGRGDVLVGTESLLSVISGATGQPLYSIPADAPGDFDRAIAFPVSDLDGDGRDEIVVAAPHADPEGLVDAGALYLFSGATGQRLRAVPGVAAEGQFGASAALLGDVNGDGRPEVVVGAPVTVHTQRLCRIARQWVTCPKTKRPSVDRNRPAAISHSILTTI